MSFPDGTAPRSRREPCDLRCRANNLASARTPIAPAGSLDDMAARRMAEYRAAIRELGMPLPGDRR